MNSTPLNTTHHGWAHLPHHIYNDIASYLNSKDYSRFRLSCLSVSQSLDSFETLRQKSNNTVCSKKFKNHCENILNDKKVRDELTGENINDICSALKNCHIVFSSNNALTFSLQTDHSQYQEREEVNVKNIVRVPGTIDSCRMAICNNLPQLPQSSPVYLSTSYSAAPSIPLMRSRIDFICREGNLLPINNIFSGFNQVFEESHGPKKYIAATMASELKDHWLKNPLPYIDRSDMLDVLDKYSELFSLGKIAKIIAAEK